MPLSAQNNDIAMKWLATRAADTLLPHLASLIPTGLPPALQGRTIVAQLPADTPLLTLALSRPDLLFRLSDQSLLHLEFQTTAKAGDLARFFSYALLALLQEQAPIHTVVIYGADMRRAEAVLDRGSVQYRVTQVFLGRLEAETVLERVRAKQQRGDPVTMDDRLDLALAPLMHSAQAREAVVEAAIAVAEALPRAERQETVAAIVGLTYHYLGEQLANALLERLLEMNRFAALLDETRTEGERQGRAEGETKGRAEGERQGRAEGERQGRAEGERQGRAEGERQGRAEGEKQAQRQAIRAIVEARFGSVPTALEERLATASSADLAALVVHAAVVATVADL